MSFLTFKKYWDSFLHLCHLVQAEIGFGRADSSPNIFIFLETQRNRVLLASVHVHLVYIKKLQLIALTLSSVLFWAVYL